MQDFLKPKKNVCSLAQTTVVSPDHIQKSICSVHVDLQTKQTSGYETSSIYLTLEPEEKDEPHGVKTFLEI